MPEGNILLMYVIGSNPSVSNTSAAASTMLPDFLCCIGAATSTERSMSLLTRVSKPKHRKLLHYSAGMQRRRRGHSCRERSWGAVDREHPMRSISFDHTKCRRTPLIFWLIACVYHVRRVVPACFALVVESSACTKRCNAWG